MPVSYPSWIIDHLNFLIRDLENRTLAAKKIRELPILFDYIRFE